RLGSGVGCPNVNVHRMLARQADGPSETTVQAPEAPTPLPPSRGRTELRVAVSRRLPERGGGSAHPQRGRHTLPHSCRPLDARARLSRCEASASATVRSQPSWHAERVSVGAVLATCALTHSGEVRAAAGGGCCKPWIVR